MDGNLLYDSTTIRKKGGEAKKEKATPSYLPVPTYLPTGTYLIGFSPLPFDGDDTFSNLLGDGR